MKAQTAVVVRLVLAGAAVPAPELSKPPGKPNDIRLQVR